MIFVLTAILSFFLWVNAASAYVITYIGTDSGFVTSGTSITKAYTITSTGADERKVLVAKIAYNSPGANDAPTSVVWNSQNFSLVSGTQSLNNGRSTEIWILPLGDTASNTNSNVVVTFAGTVSARLIIEEYNNVNQTTPVVSGGVASGTSATPNMNVTPVHTDDVAIDVWNAAAAGCSGGCSIGSVQTSTFYSAGDGNYADAVGTSREHPEDDPGVGNHHSYDGYADMSWNQAASAAWIMSGATIRVHGITNVRFGTGTQYCTVGVDDEISATYSTQTGNDKVIVYIMRWYSATPQTVSLASWQAVTFTPVSYTSGSGGSWATEIWIGKLGDHTAVTNGTVSLNMTGNVIGCVGVFEADGVSQASPSRGAIRSASNEVTSTPTLSIANVNEADLVVGGGAIEDTDNDSQPIVNLTKGSGQVRYSFGLSSGFYLVGSKIDGTYSPGTTTWLYNVEYSSEGSGTTVRWGGAVAVLRQPFSPIKGIRSPIIF